MHPLLLQTDHRPIPLPRRPWIMRQNWHDLLFAHWKVDAAQLRPLVPPELEIDLFEGHPYVAVAPFWMSGIRSRLLPPIPGLSRTPELNVRTYVRCKGVPGVYFFSLDCASRAAVWGARTAYKLPYFHAEMRVQSLGESLQYRSRRLESPQPAEFRATYRPVSQPRRREKNSLEYFLTERYCLYAVHSGAVLRACIHHLPWPLQDATAQIEHNTMATAAGITLPNEAPLLHFSRYLEVLVWWPERA